METAYCSNCRCTKPLNEFPVDENGKRRSLCINCNGLFRQRYERRKGVECMWCGKPSHGKVYCNEHRAIIRDQMRQKRDRNRKSRTCGACGAVVAAYKRLCPVCARKRNLDCQKRWGKNRVLTLYEKYGGAKCACCGETTFEFLSLDHIESNGAAHRREIGGSGSHLYAWIVRKGYPEGFQVLCYNCNAGRYRNGGVCPHKQQSAIAAPS